MGISPEAAPRAAGLDEKTEDRERIWRLSGHGMHAWQPPFLRTGRSESSGRPRDMRKGE